jgi:hypothetical protein
MIKMSGPAALAQSSAKVQNKANVAQVEQNKSKYALKPSSAEQRGRSIFGRANVTL